MFQLKEKKKLNTNGKPLMAYTLNDYFQQAGVRCNIPYASYVEMGFLPRDDQIEDLQRCLYYNRWGLYNDPGVGKTVISQAYAAYWVNEGTKVLVVMPPLLLYQFTESFQRVFLGIERYLDFHVLDQNPSKRRKLFQEWDESEWPSVLCMSYQMFQRLHDTIKTKGYDCLIADEAHALKNPESKIFKKVESYIEKWDDTAFLPMTGTPIPNELVDAYGLTKLTNPESYSDFNQFDRKHCLYRRIKLSKPRAIRGTTRKLHSIKKRTGYRNNDQIKANLYKFASRRRKSEVLDIAKPVISEIPVRLHPKHLALYKQLVRERMIDLGDEIITALQEQGLRQKMLQIVTAPELFIPPGHTIENHISLAARQVMDTINIHKTKLVMFANYQQTVELLAKEFKDLNPAVIYGKSKDANAEKHKFIDDETCRLAIANPVSAGVGTDGFQGVCSNMLFVEPTGVPGLFQQCVDRLCRHGQKYPVSVYILKAMGTLAPKATVQMLKKDKLAREVNHDKEGLEDFFLNC